MIHSRKFVAAALLLGLVMIVAGLLAEPFNGSARAAQGPSADAADRVGAAFSALIEEAVDPAISAAAAIRAAKGDFGGPACANAVWPNIDAGCLTRADGSPAAPVRTITVGYEAGPNTTVLVRVPADEMAQR